MTFYSNKANKPLSRSATNFVDLSIEVLNLQYIAIHLMRSPLDTVQDGVRKVFWMTVGSRGIDINKTQFFTVLYASVVDTGVTTDVCVGCHNNIFDILFRSCDFFHLSILSVVNGGGCCSTGSSDQLAPYWHPP